MNTRKNSLNERMNVVIKFCKDQYLLIAALSLPFSLLPMKMDTHTNLEHNQADSDGKTALHRAAEQGKIQLVKNLLQNGANLNARNKQGGTSLHAASFNAQPEICILLIEAGSDINSINQFKNTPLHLAIVKGHINVVKALLSKRADISLQNVNGKNAHSFALENKQIAIAELIAKHAESLRQQVSQTPGKSTLNPSLHPKLNPSNFLQTVMDGKTDDLTAVNPEGQTALRIAAFHGHVEIVELLLENGAVVNAVDAGGGTALHWAAFMGHTQIVELLIRYGANPNAQNKDRKTALVLAAAERHQSTIDLLSNRSAIMFMQQSAPMKEAISQTSQQVSSSAKIPPAPQPPLYGPSDVSSQQAHRPASVVGNVTDFDLNQPNPLHEAVRMERADVIKILIQKGHYINALDENCCTPLHWATTVEVLKILLANKADPSLINNNGWMPFHVFALSNSYQVLDYMMKNRIGVPPLTHHKDTPLHLLVYHNVVTEQVIATLAANGMKVNAGNICNMTPLHCAAIAGNEVAVKALLTRGALVNAVTDDNRTPLHEAATRRHPKVVEILCNAYASVNAQDRYKHTPLLEAANSHNDEDEKNYTAVIKILIDAGADLNIFDQIGIPVLAIVCSRNGTQQCVAEVVDLFIAKKANLNNFDRGGQTAAHYAARCGHLEALKSLIKAGAAINCGDSEAKTPLHLAAEAGQTDCCKVLIEAKLSANFKDKYGQTASMRAAQNGHKELAKELRKAEACVIS